jgi:glucosamine--fructose-6-phosphate aminotransferase (isomerizing)
MNLKDSGYTKFSLVNEMMEAPSLIRSFDPKISRPVAYSVIHKHRLLFTGEGSSRIFPAKNAIYQANRRGLAFNMVTDGGRQSMEYSLKDHVIVAASNSGKTKEVVSLLRKLNAEGCDNIYGITAHDKTPIMELSKKGFLLECGEENAVAATKSIIEQALFMLSIVENLSPTGMKESLPELADAFEQVLTMKIDPGIIKILSDAPQIYFAGRNNGVAEELTLKTNEITRKKADFLEGTYAVHGIEEVMNPREVLVLIEPFAEEIQKFSDVLVKGVGMKIIAIDHKETPFPTIIIPGLDPYDEFLQIASGWNLLVETGIAEGINLDKPLRARKVGNIDEGPTIRAS